MCVSKSSSNGASSGRTGLSPTLALSPSGTIRWKLLRVRQYREPLRRRLEAALNADACVERDHATGINDEWIDIQCADLTVRDGKLADADQHRGDSIDVRRRMTTVALQQSPDTRPLHLGACHRHVQGRQFQRGIPDDLDRDATLAKHDHRPEHRIHTETGNEFD